MGLFFPLKFILCQFCEVYLVKFYFVSQTEVCVGLPHTMEKEMATHSSILAWKIPWTEEPRRLQSMGPQRVGHD